MMHSYFFFGALLLSLGSFAPFAPMIHDDYLSLWVKQCEARRSAVGIGYGSVCVSQSSSFVLFQLTFLVKCALRSESKSQEEVLEMYIYIHESPDRTYSEHIN
jgi:hypothetical protein